MGRAVSSTTTAIDAGATQGTGAVAIEVVNNASTGQENDGKHLIQTFVLQGGSAMLGTRLANGANPRNVGSNIVVNASISSVVGPAANSDRANDGYQYVIKSVTGEEIQIFTPTPTAPQKEPSDIMTTEEQYDAYQEQLDRERYGIIP